MKSFYTPKGRIPAAIFLIFILFSSCVAYSDSSPFAEDASVKIKGSAQSIVADVETAKAAGISLDKPIKPINGFVDASTLRLRAWPWGEVIQRYKRNTALKVLGESGEFYLVEIDGRQGYMHKNYVTTDLKKASREVPYYPGNTRKGGSLRLAEGVKASNCGAKGEAYVSAGSSSQKGKSGGLTSSSQQGKSGGQISRLSNLNYSGVNKAIAQIVKKFCDVNKQYKLGRGHKRDEGYASITDCSGFTGQFINKLSEMAGVKPVIGKSYPRSTHYAESKYTTKVTSRFPPTDPRDLIKPGDIFVMSRSPGGSGHVGLFMGYNSAGQPLIAHSTNRKAPKGKTVEGKIGSTGVRVEVLPSHYKKRWMGLYRLNNMNQIAQNLASV